MANDLDWVADVRRWVAAAAQTKNATQAQADTFEPADLGYEAAHPALQTRDWIAGPRTNFTDLK